MKIYIDRVVFKSLANQTEINVLKIIPYFASAPCMYSAKTAHHSKIIRAIDLQFICRIKQFPVKFASK